MFALQKIYAIGCSSKLKQHVYLWRIAARFVAGERWAIAEALAAALRLEGASNSCISEQHKQETASKQSCSCCNPAFVLHDAAAAMQSRSQNAT
jgi:hypothetical protein